MYSQNLSDWFLTAALMAAILSLSALLMYRWGLIGRNGKSSNQKKHEVGSGRFPVYVDFTDKTNTNPTVVLTEKGKDIALLTIYRYWAPGAPEDTVPARFQKKVVAVTLIRINPYEVIRVFFVTHDLVNDKELKQLGQVVIGLADDQRSEMHIGDLTVGWETILPVNYPDKGLTLGSFIIFFTV